ncbi:hypothetical protein [Thermomonas fusca]
MNEDQDTMKSQRRNVSGFPAALRDMAAISVMKSKQQKTEKAPNIREQYAVIFPKLPTGS